jgi:hypothetical protein
VTPDRLELLSSLVDGEPVDGKQLAEALADPQAPGLLLDFVLMRAALSEAAEASSLERVAEREPRRRRAGWVAMAAAAAVLAAVGVVGVREWRQLPRTQSAGAPPAATRVLQFENWSEVK